MNRYDLARRFSEVLREWLSAGEMATVLERNRLQTHPGICHSHDFCDANEAMAAAHADLGIPVPCSDHAPTRAESDLWGGAWDIAKSLQFSTDRTLYNERRISDALTEKTRLSSAS